MLTSANDPFVEFEKQLNKVTLAKVPEPTAMCLSTVSGQGFPSSRMVLFKGLVGGAFSFYTNYNSQKSKELLASPKASLLFFWQLPTADNPQYTNQQQVRIFGSVEKLSREQSEAYFNSRVRDSQLGAWASEQSERVENSEILNQRFADLEKKFAGQKIPCPEHWGGFGVTPLQIEFWFGRVGRMHDRFVFERASAANPWTFSQKNP